MVLQKIRQKQLGQYFTENECLLTKIHEFIKNDTGNILEPSIGKGHIIRHIRNHGENRDVIGIEIDASLELLDGAQNNTKVIYQDFLQYDTDDLFSTIIGNPPYHKLTTNPNDKSILKSTNIYVAFIEKCHQLLDKNGELIFIIPSDFFKLTSAKGLKEMMIKTGSFTDIYHPHSENLFSNATQDVLVFRYQKDVFQEFINYNTEKMKLLINDGNIFFKAFNDKDIYICLKDIFDVKVGMVSGAERIFNHTEFGNECVLTSNGIKKEILYEDLSKASNEIIIYLQNHKKELLDRKIRAFNDKNWFQWGCLRNITFMKSMKDIPCIYAKVLTRKPNVFFIGKVQMYDGSLLCMLPKIHLSTQHLENIKSFLNSEVFLKNFLYSGRYKIGQKTLSDCIIPRSLVYEE